MKFFQKSNNQKGVTFIELIIVMSIFSVLAGTLILNFSRFGQNISIQNVAQDLALQINEAQKNAISGRTNQINLGCDRTQQSVSGNEDYCSVRYGIYFVPSLINNNPNGNTSKLDGGDPGVTLIKFADNTNMSPQYFGVYDHITPTNCGLGFGTECLDIISLGRGNVITRVCTSTAAGANFICDTDLSAVNISFKRPFPDAIIEDDSFPTNDIRYPFVRLTVSSPAADTPGRDILITALGRISIEQTP